MASNQDPGEVLRSSPGKENFQRLTRLLISGGTTLLREMFDHKHPPSDLPKTLSTPAVKSQLTKASNLTKPQRDCLYPSPGKFGKSEDFDITLLFNLLRTICNLTPPTTGWNQRPATADDTLTAALVRIKYYRNSVYAHVNQTMEITDDEFNSLWQDIREALLKIAGEIGEAERDKWKNGIDNLLTAPLTEKDERNVEELRSWYFHDVEAKEHLVAIAKSVQTVDSRLQEIQEAISSLQFSHTKEKTVLKQKTSEASEDGVVMMNVEEDDEPAHKRSKSEIHVSGNQTNMLASPGELDVDVIFALDATSAVLEEDFRKQLCFAKEMADCWGTSLEAVAYGDDAVPFHQCHAKPQFDGRDRRMDLALMRAVEDFSQKTRKHKLLVLMSAGRQVSSKGGNKDEVDPLVSAYRELIARNIQLVIVPVGLEIDFRELGLLVKRPRSLYPLASFEEMTSEMAKKIASTVKKTLDVEAYAKARFQDFSEIPQEASLWENIILCSDVLEGAWYLLYDDKKKSPDLRRVKMSIRESIDSWQRTLVNNTKISVSLAVFGNQGKGKSFLLNYLLNWGLPDEVKRENAPLPSACGEGQTPLPIYVKYGKHVEVLFREQGEQVTPDVWFSEEKLGNDTLRKVKDTLETKFKDHELRLSNLSFVEIKGPFEVFKHLNERRLTVSGHLESEVDVELVDLPGSGARIGDACITDHLSKANVVLFFNSNEGGRPVSSECVAQVFRCHEGFDFPSRPKLVHVVNDRGEQASRSSLDFDALRNEKKQKDLKEAWDCLFHCSSEESEITRYRDVRSKLPQLDGEYLMEKFRDESDLIYFHNENEGFLPSLKEVISNHVQNVIVKQMIHAVLKDVHWAAKQLKERGRNTLYNAKKKTKAVVSVETSFVMELNDDEASHLVTSFMKKDVLDLQSQLDSIYPSLYSRFLYCSAADRFILDHLKKSLLNYAGKVRYNLETAYLSKWNGIPSDAVNLAESVCTNRINDYCAHTAPCYLRQVVAKGRNTLFDEKDRISWSGDSPEERKERLEEFLLKILRRTATSLEKGGREKQEASKSCFQFSHELSELVEVIYANSCADVSKAETLESFKSTLPKIVKFCVRSIREINPNHSRMPEVPLPDRMEAVPGDEEVRAKQSSHEKVIEEVVKLMPKPNSNTKPRSKNSDPIYKLETKLKLEHGELQLKHSREVNPHLWRLSLLNVLADKDHFDVKLAPDLFLNTDVPENKVLLSLAQERLFAFKKSSVAFKIVKKQPEQLPASPDVGSDSDVDESPNESEIRLRKSRGKDDSYCLEVLVAPEMSQKLSAIRENFKDPSRDLAPIFIPIDSPGHRQDLKRKFFFEEGTLSINQQEDEEDEDEGREREVNGEKGKNCALNVFLVVKPRDLRTFRTILRSCHPQGSNVNMIVLPDSDRGPGVCKGIIKILAECLNFSLYWTVDDDIQHICQFDPDDLRWKECSFTRGLLFGQRVFQTCLAKTVQELQVDDLFELFEEATSDWPKFVSAKAKGAANKLLMDSKALVEVQKNPNLLHQPFAKIYDEFEGNAEKELELKKCEQTFVEKCKSRLFSDTINYIAGVSLPHEISRKSDYVSKYPDADYKRSNNRSQVMLNNTYALRGVNFVPDEVIFSNDEEFQVLVEGKRNPAYCGRTGSEKSFSRGLAVKGVVSYQVVRIIYKQRRQ